MKFFWYLTFFGSLAGGLFLFAVLTTAEGAPQEGAGAAIAVALAVIPYCLARSIQMVNRDRKISQRDRTPGDNA